MDKINKKGKTNKTNNPIVSVIIPIYNSEKYLSECLDSITNQTLNNIEIICVNDGSTDSSLDIIKKYQSKDERIKIINQNHSNAGSARNKGLEIAKGEYLSFLDSDDYFDKNMLKDMYLTAKSDKRIDIVIAESKQFEDEKNTFENIEWSIHRDLLPNKNPFSINDIKKDVFFVFMGWAWDKLYKTEYIKKNNFLFQSLTKQNDGYFVFCSLLKANKISVVNEYLIYHRKHEGSLERSDNTNCNYLCFFRMLTEIKSFLCEQNIYNKYKQDFFNYCLHLSRVVFYKTNKENRKKLYCFLKKEGFDKLDLNLKSKEYYYRKEDHKFHLRIKYGKISYLFIR